MPPAPGAAGTDDPGVPPATDEPPDNWFASTPITAQCQGLALTGMLYSPGGTTLPDKCHDFHPTYNNPYAVRCIDAWPHYDTGFPGDEFCILPPPPGKGVQLGYHPQEQSYFEQVSRGDMSGYENATGKFILEAGGEETDNYRALHRTDAEHNFYRNYMRMRTGSHHNIITVHANTVNGGWASDCLVEGSIACDAPGFASPDFRGVFGGQQRPDDNIPASLDKPAEDAGLYLVLPKDPTILFNLHHFNSTDDVMLKESWINVWWEEDARTRVYWMMGLEPSQALPIASDFQLRPGDIKDFHYFWNITSEYRVINLLGHRHGWTTNFTAWIERAGDPAKTEILYQSFDWLDMPTYRYDSVVKNAVPDAATLTDGALSGPVIVKPGDEIHFNCHQEFTNERANELNAGMTVEEIGGTRFANEVLSGEMCILFGTVTNPGAVTDLPARSREPAPAFAR